MKKTSFFWKLLVIPVLIFTLATAYVNAHAVLSTNGSYKDVTVPVMVQYMQTEARKIFDYVNEFRMGDQAWFWDESNSKALIYKNPHKLQYDYDLEKYAMQRAAELALYFSHTRPNGEPCSKFYRDNERYADLKFDDEYGNYNIITVANGENIAYGQESALEVFNAWKEESLPYDGQGHRRNMLDKDFYSIGIGCVYIQGVYYWVQEFSEQKPIAKATKPVDSETLVKIDVSGDMIDSYDLDQSLPEIHIAPNTYLPIPKVALIITLKGFKNPVRLADALEYSVADKSVFEISNGYLHSKKAGSTNFIARFNDVSISTCVTCEDLLINNSRVFKLPEVAASEYSKSYYYSFCVDASDNYLIYFGERGGGTAYLYDHFGQLIQSPRWKTSEARVDLKKNDIYFLKVDNGSNKELDLHIEALSSASTSQEHIHRFNFRTIREGTCTEPFVQQNYCVRCGLVTDQYEKEARGHIYYGAITPATQTTPSNITYTCVECNDQIVTPLTAQQAACVHDYATQHNFPSCRPGYIPYYCTVYFCKKCYLKYTTGSTEKIPHDFVLVEYRPGNCSEKGESLYICEECGVQEVRDETDATRHPTNFVTSDSKQSPPEKLLCKACNKSFYSDFFVSVTHISSDPSTEPTPQPTTAHTHNLQQSIEPSGYRTKGLLTIYCKDCGAVVSRSRIYAIKTIKLSDKYFAYNGKRKTPAVTVLDSKGNELVKGADYTLKYSAGRKDIGKYSVTVTFKGNYTGTKTLNFKIIPGKPTGLKATAGKQSAKLTWNPVKGATHYYVYFATAKNGTYKKAITTKGTTAKLLKLTSGKPYYFRVRAVTKLDSGAKIQGYASAIKGAKIK